MCLFRPYLHVLSQGDLVLGTGGIWGLYSVFSISHSQRTSISFCGSCCGLIDPRVPWIPSLAQILSSSGSQPDNVPGQASTALYPFL